MLYWAADHTDLRPFVLGKTMTAWIAVGVLALMLLSWGVGGYRRLGGLRSQVIQAFRPLDACLKRRYDLAPALVEAANGAMKQQRELLEAVIVARNRALEANTAAAADMNSKNAMQRMALTEGEFARVLGHMLETWNEGAAVDNGAAMSILEDLRALESGIAFARHAYNESVAQYNGSRALFPRSIIAVVFAFTPAFPLPIAEIRERHDTVLPLG
jgi:LemA protein